MQIWVSPLGIRKVLKTNKLISPVKTRDTLPHPRIAFVELPWLETAHFQ